MCPHCQGAHDDYHQSEDSSQSASPICREMSHNHANLPSSLRGTRAAATRLKSKRRVRMLPRTGPVTVSQHRRPLAHDAQGPRVVCARHFRFGAKKEAAGIYRGWSESIDLNLGPLKIDELELHNTKPRWRTYSTYTAPVRHKPTIVARAAVSGEWC